MRTKINVLNSMKDVLPVLAAFQMFLLNNMTLERILRIEHRQETWTALC